MSLLLARLVVVPPDPPATATPLPEGPAPWTADGASMKLGGYGLRPGVATLWGRRLIELSEPVADAPTSDWASLLRSGYGVIRAVVFDGIPYVFDERLLRTVYGNDAQPPTDDFTISHAFVVRQGLAVSCGPDRERGVASGRALDITLRRQSLQDEGILSSLFKTPALETRINASVVSQDDTIIQVESVAGWADEGRAYIGRECFDYTSLGTSGADAASFEGVTRAVVGLPHYHAASSLSAYARVTDVPKHWRGRFVEVFEHLVSPEGRMLGTALCVVGLYCRQTWRGYVDAEPHETAAGKTIRCLPIVRLAGQEIGAKLELEVAMNAPTDPLLAFTTADVLRVHGDATGTTVHSGPNTAIAEFATLDAWCRRVSADITSDFGIGSLWLSVTAPFAARYHIRVDGYFAGSTAGVSVYAAAWFLANGTYGGQSSQVTTNFTTQIPIDVDAAQVQWLVVRAAPSEEFAAVDVPSSGTAVIETGDKREIVRWDGVQLSDADGQEDLVALRLVERQVDGSPRADFFQLGGKVQIISGSRGTWSEVFQRLLTSSGTGDRGAYDTLGLGFGCGFPSTWIESASIDDEPMANTQVSAAANDRRSIVDVIGGWLALWSRCLVQRRNAAGEVVLAVVSTVVTDDPLATAIAPGDVLLGGHGTPEVLDAPNTIVAKSTGYEVDPLTVVYRDRARVQAEGQRRWSFVTPGATRDIILEYAPGLIIRADGQAAVSVEAPAGSTAAELQPGDRVSLETAHPTVFGWSAGAYSPAALNGVVMERSHDLFTEVVTLTILLQGRDATNALLCPSARVVRAVSSTVLEVASVRAEGDYYPGPRLVVGDKVTIYEPGNETVNSAAATISAIDYDESLITFNAVPAFAGTVPTYVTYDDYTTVTADQQSLMFVRADKRWS